MNDRAGIMVWNGESLKFPAAPKWEWKVFGRDELIVQTQHELSWWFRARATILLGSKFTRLPPE